MKRLFTFLLAGLGFFAARAQDYTMNGMEVVPSSGISFQAGTATVSPESEKALNIIRSYLDSKTYVSLMRIEGHVDGSNQDQALSEARANAVAKWLINAGVDCKRLIPVGFGNTKPVSEARAANNRIAFVNTMLKGRAIGGMPVDGGAKVAGDPCK